MYVIEIHPLVLLFDPKWAAFSIELSINGYNPFSFEA